MNAAAVQFFQEEAGYGEPPGRMVCAWLLAAAEEVGKALGWTVTWDVDLDADLSWCDECSGKERGHVHFLFVADLRDRRGKFLQSLGGVDFGAGESAHPSGSYRRVVEAELMSQQVFEG